MIATFVCEGTSSVPICRLFLLLSVTSVKGFYGLLCLDYFRLSAVCCAGSDVD